MIRQWIVICIAATLWCLHTECFYFLNQIPRQRVRLERWIRPEASSTMWYLDASEVNSDSSLPLHSASSDEDSVTFGNEQLLQQPVIEMPPIHKTPLQQQAEERKQLRSSFNKNSNIRQISRIEKFTRYPIWPAWNGLLIILLSKIFGEELASKLEDEWGGRVGPQFYSMDGITSPFIMLVHHRHSFAPWDALRYIQRSFFPEGFPSHPHRGFITVTYVLRGGMIHRDSLGRKQIYGANKKRHDGKHTQWLTTGSGMLHEEMWDIDDRGQGGNFLTPSSQELYQLWLNVPSSKKLLPPKVEVIGGEDDTPMVVERTDNGQVK